MNTVSYKKIKFFTLFGKFDLFKTTEIYSEQSRDDLDDEPAPIVVRVTKDYYDEEFDIDD